MDQLKGFIQYEKSSRRKSSTIPMVTIQKAGFLAFNKVATEAWKIAPDFVVIAWNPDTKQIALVPSEITDRTALKVRYYNSGTGQISAQGFLSTHDINHDVISHYEPEIVGNALVVTLDEKSNPVGKKKNGK